MSHQRAISFLRPIGVILALLSGLIVTCPAAPDDHHRVVAILNGDTLTLPEGGACVSSASICRGR